MDTEVVGWIWDFLLRQQSLPDCTLNSLLKTLPISRNNFKLNKSMLLRRIQTEISKGSVSENILDLLELTEELHRVAKVPVSEFMKMAYFRVAVECKSRKESIMKRVCWMMDVKCGLVSDELVRWKNETQNDPDGNLAKDKSFIGFEDLWREKYEILGRNGKMGETRNKLDGNLAKDRIFISFEEMGRKNDAMGAVRAYLNEAWDGLGMSFLEVVAGNKEALRFLEEEEDCRTQEMEQDEMVGNKGITREVLHSERNQVRDQHSINSDGNNVSQNGAILPRRKHVAKKRSRGSVAGTSRGVKITDTEQVDNQELSNRYGCLPIPAIDKVQEALTASSLELHAVVNDPLPEALQLAENVISSKNTDNRNLEVQGNKAAPERPCTDLQNNASKASLMARNSTARTYEWGDSVDDLSEGDSDSRSTIKLPSPKKMIVSPLKKHEMKNLTGRRRIKKWSLLEEETLRIGVEKYGKGCWKPILNSYPDIFEGRTDVDLKDKWRNLTRYSH